MAVTGLSLTALPGLPLVKPGDDLAALIVAALRRAAIVPQNKDVLVVAQKVVSKAEGRYVDLRTITPSARAVDLATEVNKDARVVELILSESSEIVRKERVLVVVHRLGLIMANAGIDHSNVAGDESEQVLLLPRDPDASCSALKIRLDREFGVDLGIVMNDSFGRPWRSGVVGLYWCLRTV